MERATDRRQRTPARVMMVAGPQGRRMRVGVRRRGRGRVLLYLLGVTGLAYLVSFLPVLILQVLQGTRGANPASGEAGGRNPIQLPPEIQPVPPALPPPAQEEGKAQPSNPGWEPYQPCKPRPTAAAKATPKKTARKKQPKGDRRQGHKGGRQKPLINPDPVRRSKISDQNFSHSETSYNYQESSGQGDPTSVGDIWNNSQTPIPPGRTYWKNSTQIPMIVKQETEGHDSAPSPRSQEPSSQNPQNRHQQREGYGPTRGNMRSGSTLSPPRMTTNKERSSKSEEPTETLYIDRATPNPKNFENHTKTKTHVYATNTRRESEVYVPWKVSGEEGQNISIPCIYPNESTTVIWSQRKPEDERARTGVFITIAFINLTTAKDGRHELRDSDFQMILNKTENKATLIMIKVRKEQEGWYFCTFRSKTNPGSGKGTSISIATGKGAKVAIGKDKRDQRTGRRRARSAENETGPTPGKGLEGWLKTNSWLRWATYTAKSMYPEGNCYICAKQLPKPVVVPLPGDLLSELREQERNWQAPYGYRRCILEVGNHETKGIPHRSYQYWQQSYEEYKRKCLSKYPDLRITAEEHIDDYEIDPNAEYECFIGKIPRRWAGEPPSSKNNWTEVGEFKGPCKKVWRRISEGQLIDEVCCKEAYDRDEPRACDWSNVWGNKETFEACKYSYDRRYSGHTRQDIPLTGVYWVCGRQYGVRRTLPQFWVGKCTWVRVIQATHILPNATVALAPRNKTRARRETGKEIIQPKNGIEDVPEEFMAQDPDLVGMIAAIPFVGTGIQVAQNAKWINYVYYNQQRYINYTVDTFTALGIRVDRLAKELDANTKMTVENRMVLDWMLAKEGGVCAIVGETCCTYIPGSDDDESEETFHRAMDQLKRLRDEVHDNAGKSPSLKDLNVDLSGVGSLFTSTWDWMTDTFGHLGATIIGWILKVALGITVLLACACCLVTCCGKICSRTVTRAMERQLVVLGAVEEEEEVLAPTSGVYIALRRAVVTTQPEAAHRALHPIGEEEPEDEETMLV